MRNFLSYSVQRLGTDYLDIYRPAPLDPDAPIEETIGAIAEVVEAGYVPRDRALRGRPGDDPQAALPEVPRRNGAIGSACAGPRESPDGVR